MGSKTDDEQPPTVDETLSLRPSDNFPPDATFPAQLGRYRSIAILGTGAFGTVYKAFDEELQRHVAIKVPHRHCMAAPEDVDLYLVEARSLACLDHAGIVPVYDVGRTDDGLCFIVSKFVEGTDLRARLKQDRPSREEAVQIVAWVAEALH